MTVSQAGHGSFPRSRDIAPGSRLHTIIADLLIILDAVYIAGEVAFGLGHVKPLSGANYTLASSRFPLVVLVPIAAPFYLAAQDNQREITYQITYKAFEPEPPGHYTAQLRTVWHTVFSAFFVLYYERYRPFLQDKFGRDVKEWPEFFRFCWAIRNAAAHHESRINFTNPTSAPVTWAGLTYSPANNGHLIFGPNDLSVGDILILLIEFSDRLDGLGAPTL
jgi:hypothetical protein